MLLQSYLKSQPDYVKSQQQAALKSKPQREDIATGTLPCKQCKRGPGVCFHINKAGHLNEAGQRVDSKRPAAQKSKPVVEVEMFAPGSGGATVKWTDDEIGRLEIAMQAADTGVQAGDTGVDWEQVSKQVGRPPSACSTRARRLGLTQGHPMASAGPGGRSLLIARAGAARAGAGPLKPRASPSSSASPRLGVWTENEVARLRQLVDRDGEGDWYPILHLK